MEISNCMHIFRNSLEYTVKSFAVLFSCITVSRLLSFCWKHDDCVKQKRDIFLLFNWLSIRWFEVQRRLFVPYKWDGIQFEYLCIRFNVTTSFFFNFCIDYFQSVDAVELITPSNVISVEHIVGTHPSYPEIASDNQNPTNAWSNCDQFFLFVQKLIDIGLSPRLTWIAAKTIPLHEQNKFGSITIQPIICCSMVLYMLPFFFSCLQFTCMSSLYPDG